MTAPDPRLPVQRFLEAFARQDVAGLGALLTDDCVFEDTTPPAGGRAVGRDQVLAAFAAFFAASPDARFDIEDLVVGDGAVTVPWRYVWSVGTPAEGFVRGIDLFRVRGGRVAAKHSYVKG